MKYFEQSSSCSHTVESGEFLTIIFILETSRPCHKQGKNLAGSSDADPSNSQFNISLPGTACNARKNDGSLEVLERTVKMLR